ncbi:hypothetical protein [Erythrobacter sp. JK5]|uniref:hypothetical protein n=1 Tax=Erythrobacter sp. JK5 TaxID=2829500 RepID=UPI001BA8BFDF|nr:hypothetical protein [Erythrobacter sp. JK5]QUL37113.1 hypothetical protein KDC96_12045 [Erythrobacter sp. JK5]
MIDYFALALGHGLMAVALLRLFFRPDLEVDPLLRDLADEADRKRREATQAARHSRRQGADG